MCESEIVCSRFRDLARPLISRIFGNGRTYRRGRKFAREGYLHGIDITFGEDDAVVSGFCWASQSKTKKHKLFLAVQLPGYDINQCNCSCAAGQGKCSHICGVYHYLSACGAFSRALLDRKEDTSCTSQPRQWGIPSRRIEPSVSVQQLRFQKVSDKEFGPVIVNDAPATEVTYPSHTLPVLQQLHEDLRSINKPSAFLKYFHPGESTSDSDSGTGAVGVSSVGNTSFPVASPTVLSTTISPIDASVVSTTSSATIVTTAPTVLRSQFNQRGPKQLQYPPSLAPLLDIINSAEGTAVEVADVNVWCEELVSASCLDSVQRR